MVSLVLQQTCYVGRNKDGIGVAWGFGLCHSRCPTPGSNVQSQNSREENNTFGNILIYPIQVLHIALQNLSIMLQVCAIVTSICMCSLWTARKELHSRLKWQDNSAPWRVHGPSFRRHLWGHSQGKFWNQALLHVFSSHLATEIIHKLCSEPNEGMLHLLDLLISFFLHFIAYLYESPARGGIFLVSLLAPV